MNLTCFIKKERILGRILIYKTHSENDFWMKNLHYACILTEGVTLVVVSPRYD